MASPDGQPVKANRLPGSSRLFGSRVCLRSAGGPRSAAPSNDPSLLRSTPSIDPGHVSSRIFGIFGRYDIISTPLFHTHLITKPFGWPSGVEVPRLEREGTSAP